LNLNFFPRVHFPRFSGKDKKDLTIYAPPPPWFQSTLDVLGLKFDLQLIKELDKIKTWTRANPKRKMPKTQEIEILHPDEVPEEKISRNNLLN
jgi:hypothetical protein